LEEWTAIQSSPIGAWEPLALKMATAMFAVAIDNFQRDSSPKAEVVHIVRGINPDFKQEPAVYYLTIITLFYL
jgi:hypothetical protein